MLENRSDLRVLEDAGQANCFTEDNRRIGLLKSRAVRNAIFASAKFSVMITNETGVIQFFNVGAERMLGYSSAEVINKIHFVDFHDPDEVMALTQALRLEFRTAVAPGFETLTFHASRGREAGYALAYLCKDGSRLPMSLSISALCDDDGMTFGYLLIGADDSVHQQLEVKWNTAKSAAKIADLAQANFLSNLSHELRTPLNAILGFAQLMASAQPSPTIVQKRNIDLILEAGWYQLARINEVLDLASIQPRTLSLPPESLSLADIMRECQVMMEPRARLRGVKLSFPAINTAHFVNADRLRCKQLLIDLLSHAIRYSDTGKAVVAECATQNQECIRFCIQDSGDGLPASPLAPLFQPLDSAEEDANAEQRSSGIGLTKRLVELTGDISGSGSNDGVITRVLSFELERMAHPPTADVPSTQRAFARAADSGVGRRQSVLCVMNNDASSPLVEALAAFRPDIQLMHAADVLRGAEIARACLPDVIIIDINLTGVSGVTALRIFSTDPATVRIPMIAITANALPRDIGEAIEQRFFGNIVTPIDIDELLDILNIAFKFAETPAPFVINEHVL